MERLHRWKEFYSECGATASKDCGNSPAVLNLGEAGGSAKADLDGTIKQLTGRLGRTSRGPGKVRELDKAGIVTRVLLFTSTCHHERRTLLTQIKYQGTRDMEKWNKEYTTRIYLTQLIGFLDSVHMVT